jgi:hypothetical protein
VTDQTLGQYATSDFHIARSVIASILGTFKGFTIVYANTILRTSAVLICSCIVTSCHQLVLPDFDGGTLNPDIRFLRAGEIMEGMKCAMVAFMNERERQLMTKREEDLRNPEHPVATMETRGNIKLFDPHVINVDNKDNNLLTSYFATHNRYPDCGPDRHWGYPLSRTGKSLTIKSSRPEWPLFVPGCVANRCDVALEHKYTHKLGDSVWDYTVKLGEDKGCTPVPDYSRFALDPTQTASIEFTLTATNTGYINFFKIDATKTPFFPFITAGNDGTKAPFPTLQITGKGTTVFDLTAVMPQALHTYSATASGADYYLPTHKPLREQGVARTLTDDDTKFTNAFRPIWNSLKESLNRYVKLVDVAAGLEDASLNAKIKAQLNAVRTRVEAVRNFFQVALYTIIDKPDSKYTDFGNGLVGTSRNDDKAELNKLLKTLNEFAPLQVNDFYDRCDADTWSYQPDDKTTIDYLALKKLLNNVIERQESQIYRGVPDLTLNTLALTSSFELTLEASAGTQHFFRIVPVLVPPIADIKPDHTHQLKITLTGRKQKGDNQLSKKLAQSCKDRVKPSATAPTGSSADKARTKEFCETEPGLLLESIIQAIGSSSSGG